MAKENVITEESFGLLLTWLDRDRDVAAEKYERIRGRLIRILRGRGCFEAEELADETFNHVTGKLRHLADAYTGEPALYFYGVANKLHLEWLRKQKKLNQLRLPDTKEPNTAEIDSVDSVYECLECCLKKLPAAEYRMIVEYYKEEKIDKIKNRQALAKTLGMSVNALRIRASRIRTQLGECLRHCMSERDLV